MRLQFKIYVMQIFYVIKIFKMCLLSLANLVSLEKRHMTGSQFKDVFGLKYIIEQSGYGSSSSHNTQNIQVSRVVMGVLDHIPYKIYKRLQRDYGISRSYDIQNIQVSSALHNTLHNTYNRVVMAVFDNITHKIYKI